MADVLFYVGVLQLTVVFLSVAAGVVALSLWKSSRNRPSLRAWKWLILAFVLFAVGEVVGVLDAFNIWRQAAWLRHIIPSFIMACIIVAVVKQYYVTKVKHG